MKWIDVNDDLPPKDVKCLVYAKLCRHSPNFLIMEGTFSPSRGWSNEKYELVVLCWSCPSGLTPPEELIKRLILEEFPIASEKRDESQ